LAWIFHLLRAITRRRRQEAIAAQHAALLASVLDVAPVAIWVRDHRGQFLLANEIATQIFGLGSDRQDSGDAFAILDDLAEIAKWDAQALMQHDRKVAREHELIVNEEARRYCASDGRTGWRTGAY
jgi:PAS domain-containing protein